MNSDLLLQALSSLTPNMDAGTALGVYAAIQETSDKMRKKGWMYPHACFIRESIYSSYANVFTSDLLADNNFPHIFNHVFNLLQPISLDNFLRLFPGYVTQIGRTMDILKTIEDIFVKCSLIYFAKAEWLRAESYPNNNDSYPLEPAIETYVNQHMTPTMWRELVCAVNCYSFSYVTRTLKPANDAHKIFSSYNAPLDYEIALYGNVRSLLIKTFLGKNTNWAKYITNGAHYMRKVLSQNPKIDALAMDSVINTAADSIGKIELPTDFLEAVLINPKNNDSKIENDFIFSRTIETLNDDSSILVINPAPDFLKIYPKAYLSRTTFVVPYEPMAWVLKYEFETAEFISFAEYNDCGPSSVFSEVIFFGRDLKTDTVFNLLKPLLSFASSNANLYAFIPAGCIPDLFYTQENMFPHWSLQSIDLLPLNAIVSSPKKKVLLHAKNISSNNLVRVTDYEFYTPKKTLPKRFFIRPKTSLEIALTPASFRSKHIYRIYDELLSKPLIPSRDEPKAYVFSNDITFWYTISDSPKTFGKKVEAYVCYFPTQAQIKRRHLLRGAKIKGSYASISNLSSELSIEDWCESTLPYKVRIHNGVIKAFKKDAASLFSGTITLKTLWYLSLAYSDSNAESSDTKSKTVVYAEKERVLFSSSIGKLHLCDDLAQYENAVDNYCTDETLDYRSWVWNTISSLWDFAITKGWQKTNPIKSIALSFREKAFDDHGVRSALLKKSFHPDEEMRLLDFLYNAILTNSEYLAVLIRFYTGLEPNIVSALTWSDLHVITGTNVYQFWIYQQFTNGGTIPVPLKYSEDYRRIPLVTALSNALNARRDEILKLGISAQKLKTCQITAPNDYLLGNSEHIITPHEINELSKTAVRAIGISEIVVDLPAENNGTKETNLTDYHGDIFRTNFRYHANTKAGLTDAQLRYALGHKQNTPYGNNYCDFTNDFCQITIYEKLCRWANSHKTVRHQCQTQFDVTDAPLILNGINDSDATSAVLSFTVPCHQTINVSAHAQLGLSATVTLVSKPEKGSEHNG